MFDNESINSDWIKDGTVSAEPVTTETQPDPAAAAAAAAAAPIVDETGRVHDPASGKFIEKTTTDTPAGAPQGADTPLSAPATPPAPGASAQEITEYIEGLLGEGDAAQPFKLPKGVRLPQKRGDVVEHVTVEELMKGGMRERDYQIKRQEDATARREFERTAAERDARLKAREAFIEEEAARAREAQLDPSKQAEWEEHVRLLETNPRYKEAFTALLADRENKAVDAALGQLGESQQFDNALTTAVSLLEAAAQKYPDVDVERVRMVYGFNLANHKETGARLDAEYVDSLFRAEATYLTERSPLSKELADLKAQIAKLSEAKAAEGHNATTQHAINRAKAAHTAPIGGAAPAPAGAAPVAPFGPDQLPNVNRDWAARR